MNQKKIVFGVFFIIFIVVNTSVSATIYQNTAKSISFDKLDIDNKFSNSYFFEKLFDIKYDKDIHVISDECKNMIDIRINDFRLKAYSLFLTNLNMFFQLIITQNKLTRDYQNEINFINNAYISSYKNEMDSIPLIRENFNYIQKLIHNSSLSDCDCEAENKEIEFWSFPILCSILNIFRFIGIIIFLVFQDLHFLNMVLDIATELNCVWLP